jgi:hypothetical protein
MHDLWTDIKWHANYHFSVKEFLTGASPLCLQLSRIEHNAD